MISNHGASGKAGPPPSGELPRAAPPLSLAPIRFPEARGSTRGQCGKRGNRTAVPGHTQPPERPLSLPSRESTLAEKGDEPSLMRVPRCAGTKSGTPATELNRDVPSPAKRGSAAQPAIRQTTASPSPGSAGINRPPRPDALRPRPCPCRAGINPKDQSFEDCAKINPAPRESTPARHRGPSAPGASARVCGDHPFVVSHCPSGPKRSPPPRE